MPQSTEKPTATYARSSSNARTTESQLETWRRVAEHLDFDVIHEFVDEGVSGATSIQFRPGRPAKPQLLRGLMFCDDCGLSFAATTVSSSPNNWRGAYYRCAGQIGTVEPDPELRCKAKMVPGPSIEQLVWDDCLRMEPGASTAAGFDQRRPVIEKWVRRIGVHTVGVRRHKVALVRVEYIGGAARTFRFATGDGAAL